MTVYYVRSENGAIKIGYTSSPVHKRLGSLATSSPFDLELLACENGGMDVESKRHREYSEFNIRVEWFEPCDSLNERIKNLNPDYEPAPYFSSRDYFATLKKLTVLADKIRRLKLWYQTCHYDPPKLSVLTGILGGLYVLFFLFVVHGGYTHVSEIAFSVVTAIFSLLFLPGYVLIKIWQIRKMFLDTTSQTD